MNMEEILEHYPEAGGCTQGHKGGTYKEWFEEEDDDRYQLLVVERCGNCGMPLRDDYATPEQVDKWRKGEQP